MKPAEFKRLDGVQAAEDYFVGGGHGRFCLGGQTDEIGEIRNTDYVCLSMHQDEGVCLLGVLTVSQFH